MARPSGKRLAVERDPLADNIRFFLMFTVVLGHLLEIADPFPGSKLIYKTIYSFHMPVFIFLQGFYGKKGFRRFLFRWTIPYLVWQSAYIFFDRLVLGGRAQVQYLTPYWLIWYLLAGAAYQLLIPLYSRKSPAARGVLLLGAAAAALLAGFVDRIGYPLSLSRFLVFQPFFLLGLYLRGRTGSLAPREPLPAVFRVLSAVAVAVSVAFVHWSDIPKTLLYGSYSYARCGGSIWLRLAAMLMAMSWLAFLLFTLGPLLRRRIPIFTAIGQNTLPIFLLHGFVIKALPVFAPGVVCTPWIVLLLTCGLLLLFGNKLFGKFTEAISLSWLA